MTPRWSARCAFRNVDWSASSASSREPSWFTQKPKIWPSIARRDRGSRRRRGLPRSTCAARPIGRDCGDADLQTRRLGRAAIRLEDRTQCGSATARAASGRESRTAMTRKPGSAPELPPQADEERLERELRVQVELLELAPDLADELARALGAGEPLDASRPRAARRAGRSGSRRARRPPRRRRGRGTRPRAPRATRAAPRARRRAARGEARWSASRCVRSSRSSACLAPRARLGPALGRGVEEPRRRVRRLELGIAVDVARELEQRVASLGGGGVEQALDAVEPPAGDARERGQLSAASSGARDSISSRTARSRQAPERHVLAARADRLRQRAELVGDQHDHRVRRRLLEVLEQRVGGVLVHACRRRERGRRGAAPRTGACAGRGAACGCRRSGSGRRAARARRRRGARGGARGRARRSARRRTRAPPRACRRRAARGRGTRARGPSASAAREQALRLGLLRKGLEAVHRSCARARRAPRAVDGEDTAREELRELAVGAVDLRDELVVLALDPVGRSRCSAGGTWPGRRAGGTVWSGSRPRVAWRFSSSTGSTPRPRAIPW